MVRKNDETSLQFKVDAMMDQLTGTRTAAGDCRERDITDKLMYRWQNEVLERLPGEALIVANQNDPPVVE